MTVPTSPVTPTTATFIILYILNDDPALITAGGQGLTQMLFSNLVGKDKRIKGLGKVLCPPPP